MSEPGHVSESGKAAHQQRASHEPVLLIIGAVLRCSRAGCGGVPGEESGALGAGCDDHHLILSALKFGLVVALYMHLNSITTLFTGIFVFPALLATLVICGMIFLFGPIPRHSTAIDSSGTTTGDPAAVACGARATPVAPTSRLRTDPGRQALMFNAVLGLALHGEAFSCPSGGCTPASWPVCCCWRRIYSSLAPFANRFAARVPCREEGGAFVTGLLLMFVALQGPMPSLSD